MVLYQEFNLGLFIILNINAEDCMMEVIVDQALMEHLDILKLKREIGLQIGSLWIRMK